METEAIAMNKCFPRAVLWRAGEAVETGDLPNSFHSRVV
jgi:hypothetical protein